MKAICQSMSIRSEEYRQHCAINNEEEKEEEANIYCQQFLSQSKQIDVYGQSISRLMLAATWLI